MNEAGARRPGLVFRLAGLAALAAVFAAVFAVGFPPASRDRLPVLALSGILALVAAWDRRAGLVAFAFVLPFASLGDRLAGGTDALAWPVLLSLAVAGGWVFRFLYDFEGRPDPSRVDGAVRLLLLLWTVSAALAVVRARTLWAIGHGLGLRVVNVGGLVAGAAFRGTLLSFGALGAGGIFFFLLRRSGKAAREAVLLSAVLGTAVSGGVALAQRLGFLATETRRYWRVAGRFSGGAVDPNTLGILCAAAIPVAAALAASASGRRRAAALSALPLLAAGLALSGSRSGVGLAAIGLGALLFARPIAPRWRIGVVLLAAALLAAVAGSRVSGARGSAGARLLELFDENVPAQYRVSARPVLWRSALSLFERHPLEGAGLGAFAWSLPNVLAERGLSSGISDNPGSAYLQALAETGAIGFALTLVLAVLAAREALRSLRGRDADAAAAGAGAAVVGFVAALAAGSHWFSADAAVVFFLLLAVTSGPAEGAPPRPPARAGALFVAAYAVAAAVSALGTLDAVEAFRYSPDIGFHAKEIGPGGAFRWTGRRFAVRLRP
ncbi:MAG: O-antigen ligase family protein, partial [Syntrophothermus sp.]